MAGDMSAYVALGLAPGADWAAIEQAYERLIKEHHPDREGGDARRAAAINRAYRELRAEKKLKDPVELNVDWGFPRREGRAWLTLALFLALAVGVVLLATGPLSTFAQTHGHSARVVIRMGAGPADPMNQPLNLSAIDAEVRHALHLARTKDEMALASASRDCHHLLSSEPNVLQLDRCAAFDDAVVQLEPRDPLRDRGPFSELAVTGRIWAGATALSGDSVAIDSRLDRIRLRVGEALAPAMPATN